MLESLTSRRVLIGSVAGVVAGAMVIVLGIVIVVEGTYPGLGWGFVVFGLVGVGSGIGLYRKVGWARPACGMFALLTMLISPVLFLLAAFLGADDWIYIPIALAFVGSIIAIIAAGWAGRAIFWILVVFFGSDGGGDSSGSSSC
jgi:hypothetical protein